VVETGEGQLLSPRPAAYGLFGLKKQYGAPCLRDRYRRGEAIGSGADNNGIVFTAGRGESMSHGHPLSKRSAILWAHMPMS
jgi:hypothetical protein